jgi:hypothetical protein
MYVWHVWLLQVNRLELLEASDGGVKEAFVACVNLDLFHLNEAEVLYFAC